MIVLNFNHPMSEDQIDQLEQLAGQEVDRLQEFSVQFDNARSFGEQVVELADRVDLTPRAWQSEPIVVNPPSLNVIAVALLVELHGRMGYFPPVVRLRPVEGTMPPRYEVAELIDLRSLRDEARARRWGSREK
ncbi:MAG: CRISPR-associated protein Csx15 [Chloroflexota bacterium]|nr:CRISPR-associated protein Csx15 [Chloroflexota bacterium]